MFQLNNIGGLREWLYFFGSGENRIALGSLDLKNNFFTTFGLNDFNRN